MCSIPVIIKGEATAKPISINTLFANNSQVTQLSRRLAERLGLKNFRDIYVEEYPLLGPKRAAIKWKISMCPIIINIPKSSQNAFSLCANRTQMTFSDQTIFCYPVVNCDAHDAFWEMILGSDSWMDKIGICVGPSSRLIKPTPGPCYEKNVNFLGHNIRMASKSMIPRLNEFFEYCCFTSSALHRLAINRVTCQVVAVYHDSNTVYCYSQVPQQIEELLDYADVEEGSFGVVVALIREHCPCAVLDAFPEQAVLLNWPTTC
jgi:hypothetical protein